MIVDRRPKQEWRLAGEPFEQMRLADQTSQIVGIVAHVPVVVDAIGRANAVGRRLEIEDAHRAARLPRAARQAPDQAPGVAVERHPSIGIRLLVEEIYRPPNLQY
jgi:hypothetical protein